MPDNLSLTQRRLSPTDFSQYLRLDRCERYLRLRMVEREHKTQFLEDFGVEPQNPPKVLAAGGEAFGAEIVRQLRVANVILTLDEALTTLEPGQTGVVLQPRLEATLGNWQVTGDADLIRLERKPDGSLDALIVDVKSSEAPKVEHRLQVAFYAALLEKSHGIADARLAVLYHGVPQPPPSGGSPAHREACQSLLGTDAGYLEVIADPDAYRAEVTALVQGPTALADLLAEKPFPDLFFALGTKCDACRYGEFCHKRVHLDNDLSLVPYLSARDKRALLSANVQTATELAMLKDLDGKSLRISEGREETVKRLATTSVGPRLDELVLRARRARAVDLPTLPFLPGKGHPTLPASSPELHPNLVRVFLDVQQDPVEKRAYLAGARVVAHENGEPARAENVVHLLDAPPKSPEDEAKLFSAWAVDVLACVARLAVPDENGEPRAPLHLIFWEDYGKTLLLDALARNFGAMAAAAPALYGLLTQIAAYDSPALTFLSEEIRERKNFPILCPSLHAVASYLKFDWGDDLKRAFYRGVFDAGGTLEDGSRYARRPRHSSQIPPEYVYAVWAGKEITPGPNNGEPEGASSPIIGGKGVILAFAEKRLEAIQFVADSLPTNDKTTKTPFDLSGLATASAPETTLADALGEFLTLERHAFLTGWRDVRQLAPERRALAGETLLVRYVEDDQDEGVAEHNRECARRKPLQDAWREANPKKQLRGADKDELGWSLDGVTFRLRLEWDGIEGDPATVLGLLDLKEGDSVVLSPRWSVDERLPEAEREAFTPTPKQLLYAVRARLTQLPTLEKPYAVISIDRGMGSLAGFTFGAFVRPLEPNAVYALDPSPDDIFGYWHHKVIDALKNLEATGQTSRHVLYEWLRLSPLANSPLTPGLGGLSSLNSPITGGRGAKTRLEGAETGFLAGLDTFHAAGLFHDFEEGKRDYIGGFHDEKVLLVQGPPGTGKSYSTAFAVLARIQEALRAGKPCRVFLSCKTHSATDVLLRGVAEGIRTLEELRRKDPMLWETHFDARLLDLPLIRLEKGTNLPEEVRILPADVKETTEELAGSAALVVAATPGGIYKLVKGRKDLTGANLGEWLVLDEASQMSLPEALMAALPLAPGAQLLVVGDPRQMPPIVQHEWEGERRQTFQQFPAYRSLYQTLTERGVPTVKFSESFRLHRTLAKFLRDEIYIHDGIDYRSKRSSVLDEIFTDDPLAAAALNPRYPLVVLVHDEAASQTRNTVEEALIAPILAALSGANLGVVVPHRAQRAALKLSYPTLENSIDTVERYQGDERDAILVSAVESDPEFVRAAAAFLLDPRRLNVALSRAKKKLILVASRTIFDLLPTDDELFASARFWKNLLRRACTEKLWEGEKGGVNVTVWGASDRMDEGKTP